MKSIKCQCWRTKQILNGWIIKDTKAWRIIVTLRIHLAPMRGTNSSWLPSSSNKALSMLAWSSPVILMRCSSLFALLSSRSRLSGNTTQRRWSWSAELKLTMKSSLMTTNLSKTLSDSSFWNSMFTSTSWSKVRAPLLMLPRKEGHLQHRTRTQVGRPCSPTLPRTLPPETHTSWTFTCKRERSLCS